MGDIARSVSVDASVSARSARALRRPRGRRWTALGMAFCAIAAAGSAASAQTLWEDPAFALYQQAVEAINKKDYDSADRLAGEAIKQYPTHVLAYYLRAQSALARSKWDAAAADLAKVTELYPGSFAGQRDLGLAYQQLDRVDDAKKAYEAALKLKPNDETIEVRLAFMLVKADRSADAQPILQQLAARDSKIPEVWTAIGRIAYEENDLAGTEKAFVRALALKDDGRTWFNLGVVRLRMDNRTGAVEAFERASKHAETKDQAAREIERIKTAGGGPSTGPTKEVQRPGTTSVQPARPGY